MEAFQQVLIVHVARIVSLRIYIYGTSLCVAIDMLPYQYCILKADPKEQGSIGNDSDMLSFV